MCRITMLEKPPLARLFRAVDFLSNFNPGSGGANFCNSSYRTGEVSIDCSMFRWMYRWLFHLVLLPWPGEFAGWLAVKFSKESLTLYSLSGTFVLQYVQTDEGIGAHVRNSNREERSFHRPKTFRRGDP